MELTYSDFRNRLPRSHTRPNYLGETLGPRASQNQFVEPNVQVVRESSGARIGLISAPAAVGKSFLARQLSADNNALYWDLASFSLGSNFFVGTAVSAYQPEGYPSFLQELRAGERLLVLDAADEALVRAGRENYVAAITNLADITSESSSMSVIILGRSDTIDDTAAVLSAHGVATNMYSVSYFTEDQSYAFVKYKAEQLGNPAIKEFTPFMRGFFGAVSEALGASSFEGARAFLGYAPVLDALAAYYADEINPIKFLEAVKRAGDRQHVWELLHRIVQEVLTREQGKFARNFSGETSGRKWQFGFDAFTPEAQLTYLLDTSEARQAVAFSQDGESDWYAELEDQLELQLKEHPFLKSEVSARGPNPLNNFANAAFRDYALARVFSDESLLPHALLEGYWRSPELNPTPILAGLIFAGLFDYSRGLPPAAFGIIHDSHAAENEDGGSPFLITSADLDNDGNATGISVHRIEGRAKDSKAVSVRLDDRSPSLYRRTARAIIDLQGLHLRAGDGFADFLIGPTVFIACDSFDSFVSDIRVRANGIAGGVTLWINNIGGSTKRLDCIPADSLQVKGDRNSIPHPWFRFASSATAGISPQIVENDLAMEVRRAVMWFTKPSMFGGGLRYPVGAVDALVGKRRVSAEFIAYLNHRQLLERAGDEYVMSLPVQTGSIVRNDLADPELRAFLFDFGRWKSGPTAS
ncbi:hypothetical protein [Curtobacterium citreum]|uniref:Uncharacterized protein n=1 Tax=Curtobacterium citreum TaxID=2036 RepID=A0ABU8Y589_9MICO